MWLGAALVAMTLLMAQVAHAQAERPDTFADLVDQVGDAVVNITTTSIVAARQDGPQGIQPMLPPGSPFEEFFNDFMNRNGPGGQVPRRSQALGSGFVISEDGFIVTNNHVIEGADEISVEFRSGEMLQAELIGTDPNTDIALLKVDPAAPLTSVSFGDSDALRVGDWVMAMGNPLGQGFSVSVGVVSARGRELSGAYDDFIQTDAAINRGNSGGPLFNLEGEVIGVNTAILSPNGGSIGIGFSMASAVVSDVVNQLQQFGETRRGWLGVRIQDVSQDIADGLSLDEARGALVTDVPEGPARDAGVEVGDVILSFDGQDIEDTRELVRVVAAAPVGETVEMDVLRAGAMETLSVTLGRRETADATAGQPDPVKPASVDLLGLRLGPLGAEARAELQARGLNGVVIEAVDPNSDAASKGLQAGDIVTELAQMPISTPQEFEQIVTEARDAGQKSILLLIRRGGDPRFVALSLLE
ncbi:Do family serine endopeptidase [Rhodobacteraceae bacterium XHP0102]|nr:Do family serine endopeptidase [Rhodobacteraceae bacterium XHP0102]